MRRSLHPRLGRRGLAAVTCGAVLGIGVGSGAAFAFFTGSGSGSGASSVGTAQAVQVDAATGTPSSLLLPGGTSDLTLTVDNPNSYAVTITSVTQNGSVTPVGGIAGCTNIGVSVPTQTGLSVALAAGAGVIVHIPNGAVMGAVSDTGCQGASFQVPVTITVQR